MLDGGDETNLAVFASVFVMKIKRHLGRFSPLPEHFKEKFRPTRESRFLNERIFVGFVHALYDRYSIDPKSIGVGLNPW